MGKRNRSGKKGGLWKGTAAGLSALMILSGAFALLVQKGLVGSSGWRAGMILICLLAGITATLAGPKGEGTVGRLLSCGIPAGLLLLAGVVFGGVQEVFPRGLLHAICLLLPGLAALALREGGSRKPGSRRKRQRLGSLRH